MPAWATVTIALGASVIAVAGTLGATWLQNVFARRERQRQDAAARRDRAAEILGPIRTLLTDLDPTRVGFNIDPSLWPAQRISFEHRVNALREQLAVYAAGAEDERIARAARALEVGLFNTFNRLAWHIGALIRHSDESGPMYEEAQREHERAIAVAGTLLELVHGRAVDDLDARLGERGD